MVGLLTASMLAALVALGGDHTDREGYISQRGDSFWRVTKRSIDACLSEDVPPGVVRDVTNDLLVRSGRVRMGEPFSDPRQNPDSLPIGEELDINPYKFTIKESEGYVVLPHPFHEEQEAAGEVPRPITGYARLLHVANEQMWPKIELWIATNMEEPGFSQYRQGLKEQLAHLCIGEGRGELSEADGRPELMTGLHVRETPLRDFLPEDGFVYFVKTDKPNIHGNHAIGLERMSGGIYKQPSRSLLEEARRELMKPFTPAAP